MPGLGWQEILVVMVIALLVLGPAKLPEMARTVGKGIREFKGGMAGLTGLGDLGGSSHASSEPDGDSERTSGVTPATSHDRASELPPAGLPPAAPPPAASAEPPAPRPAGTHR
jgi:TatA/E family protein of Tat protein translocase